VVGTGDEASRTRRYARSCSASSWLLALIVLRCHSRVSARDTRRTRHPRVARRGAVDDAGGVVVEGCPPLRVRRAWSRSRPASSRWRSCSSAIAKPARSRNAFPWTTILQLLIAAPPHPPGRVRRQQPGAEVRPTDVDVRDGTEPGAGGFVIVCRCGPPGKPHRRDHRSRCRWTGDGHQLKRAGYEFTIYEKATVSAGRGDTNTYPGAQCTCRRTSTRSSFELNPGEPDLRNSAGDPRQSRTVHDQYGWATPACGHRIVEARWDEPEQHWNLLSDSGETFTRRSRRERTRDVERSGRARDPRRTGSAAAPAFTRRAWTTPSRQVDVHVGTRGRQCHRLPIADTPSLRSSAASYGSRDFQPVDARPRRGGARPVQDS